MPYVQILFCAILWGLAGPIIKWSELPFYSIISIRLVVPLALTYMWIRFVEKQEIQKVDWPLAWISLLCIVSTLLYILAFYFTSISNVLLLLYTRPVLTTFLAMVLLSEHITKWLWALLFLSFAGAVMIITAHEISFESRDMIGMTIALITAFVSGLGWAYIKKMDSRKYSATQILFHQHFFGGLLSILYLPSVFETQPLHKISIAILYPVIVGFIGSIYYYKGLSKIPLSRAMPLTYAELIVAIACGVYFFSERLSPQIIGGGALILIGALGTLRMQNRAVKKV